MRKNQRGLTFIGWLVLLVPLAIVLYAGLRLSTVYLNYMKVVRGLNALVTENSSGGVTADNLRNSLQKHFDVDSVDYPDIKDIKFAREGKAWIVEAAYDDQAPLFANISIQIAFDKKVQIGSSGDSE